MFKLRPTSPATLAIAVLATAASSCPAWAAGTLAGILIENRASATYVESGAARTVPSNTVSVLVDEVLDVAVSSLDGSTVPTSGGSAVLSFSVRNTGNGPEAFALQVNPALPANDFAGSVAGIAVDANGNGIFDPGIDTQLTAPEQTAIIAPDAALTVFVQVTLPADASDGGSSGVELSARALTGSGAPGTSYAGLGANGGDAVVGSSTASAAGQGTLVASLASVELVKSASVTDPFGGAQAIPGARVLYTIQARVTGSGSVSDLVVSDPIPDGTTYQPASLAMNGQPLSDGADADAGTADTNSISVNLGSATGGTTHEISFAVLID